MTEQEKLIQSLLILKVGEWQLIGRPTNEDEFNASFRKVMSEDSNGQAVLSTNPNDFGVTWTQIKTEMEKL
tara:strand:- start:47 stop:259 length:213 start_codon:yes stop_codon:yes gene_type:complete